MDELEEQIELDIYPITDEKVNVRLQNAVDINAKKLSCAIQHYTRTNKQKAFDLALQCAKLKTDKTLLLKAFEELSLYKNNTAVEDIFINWILEDTDPHSLIKKVVDNYWK